jgi:hypothetical protein
MLHHHFDKELGRSPIENTYGDDKNIGGRGALLALEFTLL